MSVAAYGEDQDEAPSAMPGDHPIAARVAWGNPTEQLETIQEMLGSMETQTVPGIRYTMDKVLGFLRKQIRSEQFVVSPRNRRIVAQQVDQLTREAERMVPDARLFADRADTLVVLLLALGNLL
jgi:hypothetical protein